MFVYNAPVVLTFAILSFLVLGFNNAVGGWLIPTFFVSSGTFNPLSIISYLGTITHILGHANWAHLSGNFLLILLVGPMLEEKYGSRKLLIMILITAILTSILNTLMFATGIIGASGIAFMMILLASFANVSKGQIPITFLLTCGLFLGQEIVNSLKVDNISQFAHILGGICGAIFGITFLPQKSKLMN